MNKGFIWGMIICVVSIIIIAIAIALYFIWKERKDYDEDKKYTVWGVAGAGVLGLLFGIIFVIWGASKKESDDSVQKAVRQNTPVKNNSKVSKVSKVSEVYPPPPIPPKPIIGPPKNAYPSDPSPQTGALYAKGVGVAQVSKARKPKKVNFAPPGSSVTSKTSKTPKTPKT